MSCSCNVPIGGYWSCAVCPAVRPADGDSCATNTSYECRFGEDTCTCDGNNWYCVRPSCAADLVGDPGGGCSWPSHYTCSFPSLAETCTCADVYGERRCSCPPSLPAEGSACLGTVGPDAGGCSYGDKVCDCQNGFWHCSPCPLNPPSTGTSCSAVANCAYPNALCYCDGAAWSCS